MYCHETMCSLQMLTANTRNTATKRCVRCKCSRQTQEILPQSDVFAANAHGEYDNNTPALNRDSLKRWVPTRAIAPLKLRGSLVAPLKKCHSDKHHPSRNFASTRMAKNHGMTIEGYEGVSDAQ